jgi:fatty acid desaturase
MNAELRRMAMTEWTVILLTWAIAGLVENTNLFQGYALGAFSLIAILVIAGRFHALGVILHDAVHARTVGNGTGRIFQLLCAYPIATTLEAMRYHHLRHHNFYGTDLDPYLKRKGQNTNGFMSVSMSILVTLVKASILVPVWILRPLIGVVARKSSATKAFYQRALLQDRAKELVHTRELEECLSAEYRQFVFWCVVVIVAITLESLSIVSFATILKFYFFPLWLAGFVNVWRVLIEHDHTYRRVEEIEQDPNKVWITTKTISVPGFDWFFAPRNIGYHQAHHLFPAVGLKYLPELHRRLFSNRNHGVVDDSVASIPIAKGSN